MNETRRGYRAIGMGVAATLVASFGLVSPAAAQEEPPTSASGIVASLVDEIALTQAVEGFTAGDEASVAALAAVVAPEAGVDVDTATHVSLDAGELVVASDEAIGEGGDALTIGISYAGVSQEPEIVDGVAVSTQVEAGLDIVARATDDGAQVLAVLADENAPTQLAFDLDLPQGATLEPLQDGSIAVFAPVETEVPLSGEEERIDAAVLEILGEDIFSSDDLDALDAITDEQFELLAQIPDEETKSVVGNQQVGLIHAPWAVDAEGNAVETSYNLVDGKLIQTVVTDENTVFPVVADPSMTWRERGIAALQCIASVYAMSNVATAAVKFTTKAVKLMKNAKKGSKLSEAYEAWKQLGKLDGSPAKTLVIVLKDYLIAYAKNLHKGASAAAKAAASKVNTGSKARKLAGKVLLNGVIVFTDVMGLKDCVRAVTGVK